VLKRLAWRLVETGVLVFAALGFCYVPLGERTGYEHARAIAASPEVRDFAAGMLQAGRSLHARLLGRLAEVVHAQFPATDDDPPERDGSR